MKKRGYRGIPALKTRDSYFSLIFLMMSLTMPLKEESLFIRGFHLLYGIHDGGMIAGAEFLPDGLHRQAR